MKLLKKGFLNISETRLTCYMAFVGLAIIAAAGVAVYVKINSAAAMTTTLKQLFNQTQSLRTATGYGTGDVVPALIRSGALPKDLSVVDNTLFFNAMGGAITVTGNDTGFIVSTTGIDKKYCWRFAMIADNVNSGSTRINSAAAIVGKISPAQASDACVVGKSNTVTFTLDS